MQHLRSSIIQLAKIHYTLNNKQMAIFKQIELYYNTLITNHSHIEPLNLIIMETAGIEKLYLINMI